MRRRRKRGSGAIADDLVRRHDRCGRRGRSEGGCWALLLLLRSESSTALLPRVHQCYTRLGQQSTKRESSMASGLSDGGCNLIVGDAFCRQPRAQAPEARVQQLGCDRLVHAAHWQRSSSSAGSLDPPAKRVSQRHQATPTSRRSTRPADLFGPLPNSALFFSFIIESMFPSPIFFNMNGDKTRAGTEGQHRARNHNATTPKPVAVQ